MKYLKADEIFPDELLIEIQKYAQGNLVYIPKPKVVYKKWGEVTGGKLITQNRNEEIKKKFHEKVSIEQLSHEYCLCVETIKKIVYKK